MQYCPKVEARRVNDFALLFALLGNDFVPHVPHWHIHRNAPAALFAAYNEIQKSSAEPLFLVNADASINWPNLALFLTTLIAYEDELITKSLKVLF